MPRTKKQNETIREQRRQLIIDTALALFANEGYNHTSIAQIAQKAGISKGLLYNYFESKEALLNAILRSGADNVYPEKFKKNISPEDFLSFLSNVLNQVEEQKDFYKLYTALSTQPQVQHLLSDFQTTVYGSESKNIMSGFVTLFGDNAVKEILLMSALTKGFSILSMYGDKQQIIPVDLLKDTILDFYKEKLHLKNDNTNEKNNSTSSAAARRSGRTIGAAKPQRHGNRKKSG